MESDLISKPPSLFVTGLFQQLLDVQNPLRAAAAVNLHQGEPAVPVAMDGTGDTSVTRSLR